MSWAGWAGRRVDPGSLDDWICVTGSTFLVSELRPLLLRWCQATLPYAPLSLPRHERRAVSPRVSDGIRQWPLTHEKIESRWLDW